MRTLDVNSRALGTFAKSYSLLYRISYIIQEEKSGDFYVTARHAISRITYAQGAVSLISGAIRTRSYIDGTLPISRYSYPRELVFVAPHTLLVADRYNHKLRLVAMDSDQVTTLNVTNSLYKPQTLILTSNTLYVGYQKTILQRKCEYHSTYSFTWHIYLYVKMSRGRQTSFVQKLHFTKSHSVAMETGINHIMGPSKSILQFHYITISITKLTVNWNYLSFCEFVIKVFLFPSELIGVQ